ncbi:hypothetical protein TraAM80_03670 [Trypanosoma rangeli]|uniref:Uncharacterized protein n=1 Tax=Trypanosoma rangeli TaxID=5698 RepID=A0A3R7L3V1_TRYRA|nr:uncharacterized protein TraAM80_03670 [Trypanosoma rangeli]RNF07036.1 hypothetical protein TraAM80_03670 [Trypanosoma rangeli]|eukprot:RNF07036.1 hypothetical protein TraAM80_03670 [Trypanosoma rangeli]
MSHDSALTQTLDETGVERFAFSYLLRRVETAMRVQYGSKRVFVTACKDIGQLWSALDSSVVGNDEYQALLPLWTQFLKEGLLFMTSESPLLCARAFLESVVVSASCSTVKDVSSITAANTACVGEIISRLLSEMSQLTSTLSSLIPPLGHLQEVRRVIELLQEYQLASAGNVSSPSTTKLVEAYNALVERYASMFVEEVAFPSYWNLDLDKSSLLLVNGVHPAIYFCFMSLVRLVQWCGYRVHMIDDVPCRQIVAHVWESGALVVAAVAEERELSESLKKQLQLDTMHFVLFARMFRKFVGERLFGVVSCSLLRLLESVARRLQPNPDSSGVFIPTTDAFEMDIWNVPPVEASEWAGTFDANGRKKTDAFVPWSEEFIRAPYVRKAQMPPNGWQYISFRNL